MSYCFPAETPWEIIETYADLVRRRHAPRIPSRPPVSWCSWYPYRLGVTEDKILANSRVAALRLKSLGLSIMQVDLGWQKGYLPSSFEENRQFPHGLEWLSQRLGELGFRLGAWIAPFTVSEFDSLVREHPDWLLGGEEASPLKSGEWFWQPHGAIYALDLSHPEAQRWLREKVASLAQRGVTYLKADFLATAADPALRSRHDPGVVAAGGTEALRRGMDIMKKEMISADPRSLLLNCSGPEIPGTGSFPLLYACNDSGNTGYVGWEHHKVNYGLNLAGHLFKQGKWGIIQPSCLCVGLPGTLKEARLRATATFMSGGQVDISDDLTLLPEDRWKVLLATLPPLGKPAKPVELFEPIMTSHWEYDAMSRGEGKILFDTEEEVSRVWSLTVESSWDTWELIALFNYDAPRGRDGRPRITAFHLPMERIGLQTDERYWGYEFWSRQFLGEIPRETTSETYTHHGDSRSLVIGRDRDKLLVSFFGPAVKLLIFRRLRDYPWVVGTSFHQSGGIELDGVVWESEGVLKGDLNRPAGENGWITIVVSHRYGTTSRRSGGM